jgi:hypothetical protein
MVAIKNALWSSLTIELLGSKTLTLEPRETQEISEQEFASEGCQQLFREGKIVVLPEK